MSSFKEWLNHKKAEKIASILSSTGYTASVEKDIVSVREKILKMIPLGSSIALGGSTTVEQMDLLSHFRSDDYCLYDRYQNKPFAEIVEIMRQSMTADFLITGTNAITMDGELVNIDSSGNRAAGIIFGPKKVIVVAGVNKIVKTLHDALERLKEIAPMNALRNKHEVPCIHSGFCEDCMCPQRVCNVISIVQSAWKFEGRITVFILPTEIGF